MQPSALILLLATLLYVQMSNEHGYLIEPPSRSSAWLVDEDFNECCQYFDHAEMFCGGKRNQWKNNSGKCGICGEAWDEPVKKFEKGGELYLGKIVREYKRGSTIPVQVEITANHRGSFEFRLCNIDGWNSDATQECLDQTILYLDGSLNETKYLVEGNYSSILLNLTLPDNLTCDHCIFQWKWHTGNSWGINEDENTCVGCGNYQEEFFGCADIAVKNELKKAKKFKKFNLQKAKSAKLGLPKMKELKKCETSLVFGATFNITQVVNVFCEKMCNQKCLVLEEAMSANLRNKILNEPTDDLITCLDTCPKLCSC